MLLFLDGFPASMVVLTSGFTVGSCFLRSTDEIFCNSRGETNLHLQGRICEESISIKLHEI